jgi:tRNA dimethylallyltransferase
VQGSRETTALIVAGPTASGKSALALALAGRFGGTIINADSMQVYRELRVLTARPSAADEARVPHALYGVRPVAEAGSVVWWRGAALAAMAAARAAGRLPILCGGTGLYFAALTGGLADIPDPGPAARAEARALLAEIGPAALHARLAAVDPVSASRLDPADSQRIARAFEVWRGTGRGLSDWQSRGQSPGQPPSQRGARPLADALSGLTPPPASGRFAAILLDPPRADLRAAVAGRFAAMLAAGALDEVRALLALNLDPALPAMRAHGVPQLAAHLRGEITLAEATSRAELVTGQYTKRQATWFRHHALAETGRTHTIHARYAEPAQFSERNQSDAIAFVQELG